VLDVLSKPSQAYLHQAGGRDATAEIRRSTAEEIGTSQEHIVKLLAGES
jgi:hypothetical protein